MNDRGKIYEDQAAVFLERAGLKLIRRNWSAPTGEIDIIASEKDTLVFVEVRGRSNTGFGSPAETVTKSKQLRIIKTAIGYLKTKTLKPESIRFDVVAIVPGTEPEHIRGAFDAGKYWY
ncbi:MAG TPA: YraN family protein [Elusimicrobia bacterium]|nr:YraN family protein [Elusimicrobiota bacterium]